MSGSGGAKTPALLAAHVKKSFRSMVRNRRFSSYNWHLEVKVFPRLLWWSFAAVANEPIHIEEFDLRVLKQVSVEYPTQARYTNLDGVVCMVDVTIDAGGVPTKVAVRQCPLPFHAQTQNAVSQWQWTPYQAQGGEAQPAWFTMLVRYQLQGSPAPRVTTQLSNPSISVTKHVIPEFPSGSTPTQEVVCNAKVVATSVTVTDCPDTFAASTKAALEQWTFDTDESIELTVRFSHRQ